MTQATFPYSAGLYGTHGLLRDAVSRCNIDLPSLVGTDRCNLFFGQLCLPLALSFANAATAFLISVLHVLRVRPKPQMGRVDACWVVASVADRHAGGDGAAVVSLPCNTVGNLVAASNLKPPVSANCSTKPQEAPAIGLRDRQVFQPILNREGPKVNPKRRASKHGLHYNGGAL